LCSFFVDICFFYSITNHSFGAILKLNDSNNVFLQRLLSFKGPTDITANLIGQNAKKHFLAARTGMLKSTVKKTFILPKLINQIQPNFA